jgi:putative phage-type endonuclease
MNLKKNTIVSQTKEWYEIREKKISATNISTIIGINHYKNKEELLNDKIYGLDKIDNIYTKHGNKFEDITINILENKLNIEIQDVGFKLSKKYNFLGATPDGITIYNNEICLVEIKCPFSRKISGIPSFDYYCQMQTQMEVFEIEKCLFYECDIEEITKSEYRKTLNKSNLGYYKIKNIYWKLKGSSLNIVHRDRCFYEYYIDDINNFSKKLEIKLIKKNRKNRKRKYSEISNELDSIVKYQKTNEGGKRILKKNIIITKQYLNHYIKNDKCEVWLNFYGKKYYKDFYINNKFSREILNKSIEHKKNFLQKVKQICQQKKLTYVVLPYYYKYNHYLIELTKKHMKDNVDVIINPCFYEENNGLYSNPTMIVKSHTINNIFPNIEIYRGDSYILINRVIKNLKYINSGENLSNNIENRSFIKKNNFDHFILNKNQKTMNTTSFIIGNKWHYMEHKIKIESDGYNDFTKLGVVDLLQRDTNKLIYKYKFWLENIRNNDDKYIIFNDKSYTPNYCANEQSNWLDFKKSILEKNNDIVLVYGIGMKTRKLFNNDNIFSWKDKNFFKNINNDKYNLGENKINIIKNILKLNNTENLIYPSNLPINTKTQLKKSDLEIYCDFETVNNFLGKENLIYLIGMSIKYKEKEISYEYFFADKEDNESEKNIMDNFIDRINELEDKYDCDSKVYCWSKAEFSFLNNFNKKNNLQYSIDFIDLLEIFKSNCILIKNNIYGFGLKNYVKSMYDHGMITSNYKSGCDSGDKSIISALNYYNNNDIDEYWSLIKYNNIDCTIMYEILTYIRNYYKIN